MMELTLRLMLAAVLRHTAGNAVQVLPVLAGAQDVGFPTGVGRGTQAAARLICG